jgi:fatty acid desaturase
MSELETRIQALRRSQSDVGLARVGMALAGIGACWGLAAALPPLHWIWIAPIIGLCQYRIVISGHEAVHGTLCRSKALNDVVGVVGQALVGVSFPAYREQHLAHHKALETADDPDGHIYGPVVAVAPGARRALVWIFGVVPEVMTKLRQKGVAASGGVTAVIAAQLALAIGAAAVMHAWWGWLVLWAAPLGVAILLNRTRLVIEHGLALDMDRAGARLPTVDIVAPLWQRMLLSPFSFNYHCSHHLFMAVPHHALPELHTFLRERGHPGFVAADGDYVRSLRRVILGPTDSPSASATAGSPTSR